MYSDYLNQMEKKVEILENAFEVYQKHDADEAQMRQFQLSCRAVKTQLQERCMKEAGPFADKMSMALHGNLVNRIDKMIS